jgi:Putative MetA-pathway of phenol degradation
MNPRFLAPVLLMLSQGMVFAVNPLVTDDADTVEPGHLQLNAGWQLSRTGSVSLYSIPLNPVLGVSSRGELGATFGYQWRASPAQADGITDLAIATKWRLWHTEDNNFKVSTRFDLKVPTASEHSGLGRGKTDTSVVLIATRCWGPTCLDWNIGYSAIDLSHAVFSDDQWFLGQAVRQQLTERWTLIGEIYALLPQGDEGGSANVHFSAGAQFIVHENFLVSALIGSAAGSNSPDLTSYLGFTLVY